MFAPLHTLLRNAWCLEHCRRRTREHRTIDRQPHSRTTPTAAAARVVPFLCAARLNAWPLVMTTRCTSDQSYLQVIAQKPSVPSNSLGSCSATPIWEESTQVHPTCCSKRQSCMCRPCTLSGRFDARPVHTNRQPQCSREASFGLYCPAN